MMASHGEGWRGRTIDGELRKDWQEWHSRVNGNRGGIAVGVWR